MREGGGTGGWCGEAEGRRFTSPRAKEQHEHGKQRTSWAGGHTGSRWGEVAIMCAMGSDVYRFTVGLLTSPPPLLPLRCAW